MVKSRAKVVTLPRSSRAGKNVLSQLNELAQRLTFAVEGGPPTVFSEAEHGLAGIGHASSVHIIANVGGFWRSWRYLDMPDAAVVRSEELPPNAHQITQPTFRDKTLFLPVRTGVLAALFDNAQCDGESFTALRVAAGCLDLALATCERHGSSTRSADELREMHAVASCVLQTSDIDELLLIVTHEAKRLLSSDICGVMLRDGDEVVMRHCVGNFSIETAKLRMQAGQGVAGRVLETLQPLVVPNYLESEDISQDFFNLARAENVRSALAVPILSHGEVMGVLEVWRRHPTAYSSEDSIRLIALAGLTSLALDNRARQSIIAELAETNANLEAECATARDSMRFQQELIGLLLMRKGLNAIASEAARQCDAKVLILNCDLAVEAAYPERGNDQEELIKIARRLLPQRSRLGDQALVHETETESVCVQPVTAGSELLACVVCATETPMSKFNRLALTQIATVVALYFLERREAARARAETMQAVLWDLLEGSDDVRAAAMDRAKELNMPMKGDKCVIVCRIDGLDALGIGSGADVGAYCDRLVEIARSSELGGLAQVIGLRGSELRMVCRSVDKARLIELAKRLVRQFLKEIPQLNMFIGVSGTCNDGRHLPTAFREAKVALEVAQHQTDLSVTHYSDVGLMGLLINLRSAADMRRVSGEILGDLLSEPESSRDMLIKTLKAFFEANCSQLGAAATLGTHQKTIAYRLAKVSRLSGLDLSKHQDRLLADLAIRVFSMINMKQSADSE